MPCSRPASRRTRCNRRHACSGTITFTPEACTVQPGNTAEADCFVKGTKAMFLDVWNGRYVPTLADFLMGRIRSNNPTMLKDFYAAFVRKKALQPQGPEGELGRVEQRDAQEHHEPHPDATRPVGELLILTLIILGLLFNNE